MIKLKIILLVFAIAACEPALAQETITQQFIIQPSVGCVDPDLLCPATHTYRVYLDDEVITTSDVVNASAALNVSIGDTLCFTVTQENSAGESVKSAQKCRTYDGSAPNAPIILELPLVVN